ncbi:MAG TPA: gluconate 2-dehydrogenase subunit 3 family protein [Oleiagrimonas sp.]|nr:gluconate 2-dehydrogenase subunit 3 family protein [Oleiagrimonas sp.]
MTRRYFLKTTALSLSATTALAGCATPHQGETAEYVFFSAAEAAFIDAAISRLIPRDELGPGAREANVLGFLDLQLAGAYGRAERWYMKGPWPSGTDQQGFQNRLTPAGIYRAAIADIDAYCRDAYGKRFAALTHAQQDDVLKGLEANRVTLQHSPADTFFALLWQNTQEGFLADPVYHGNRHFIGWKLIGFPGPRYNYVAEIEHYGKPYDKPCVSLAGRHPDPLARET